MQGRNPEILIKKTKNEFLNQTQATSIDDFSGSIHDSDKIPSQDEGHACPLSDDVQFV